TDCNQGGLAVLKQLEKLAAAIAAAIMTTSAAWAQAPGVTEDTITIGAYGPITTGAAFVGLGGRDGMILAIEEVNAAGGIHGRKIEAIFEDDAFSPTKALAAVKKLVEQDGVFMILGLSGSNPTVAT